MTVTDSRPAIAQATPTPESPGGTPNSQQAKRSAAPKELPPAGASPRPAAKAPIPTAAAPGGTELADRHATFDTQGANAVGDQPDVPGPTAKIDATPAAQSLLDPALCLAADILDDLEKVRTANENRLRQLTRGGVDDERIRSGKVASVADLPPDKDGELRGFSLDERHRDVARLAAMVEALKRIEHDATLQLQRQLRRHPLHGWVKAQRGVGEKQAARLLAAIGDPYVNSAKGEPRTVSALWAYAGLHVLPASQYRRDVQGETAGRAQLPADRTWTDTHPFGVGGGGGDPGRSTCDTQSNTAGVAPKRQRGQRTNWSTTAKTRAYLIATSCLKQLVKPCQAAGSEGQWRAVHHAGCVCSPYRVVYDRRRAHTATTHPDWSDGHSHQDALRVASKAILRDLWREAKEIHELRAVANAYPATKLPTPPPAGDR